MNTETDGVVELDIASPVVEKKTRGRKKKIPDNIVNNTESVIETVKPLPKKRGRKPKGGKIVQETSIDDTSQISEPNIILHLRCSLEDINENETYTMKYNPNIESVQSFNFDNSKIDNLLLEQLDEIQTIEDDNDENDIICLNNKDDRYLESITDKLNSLKTKLHRNTISDKRSACFWCT
jgi:hypothetical protein